MKAKDVKIRGLVNALRDERSLRVVLKQELMEDLVAEIKSCRECRLWRRAKNPVPGEGSLDASLIFVGEAPGYWEDVKGSPFVGAAGKLLDELLASIDLKRLDVYITNVVKHRPPANRDPRPDEVETCAPYLDRQIQIIKPEIIVTLGRHSTIHILSKGNIVVRGITEVRGQIHIQKLLNRNVKIIPTFHPAAALYNPKYRSALEKDFQTIKIELHNL